MINALKGKTINHPLWPEKVEIESIKVFGSKLAVRAIGKNTKRAYGYDILSEEDIQKIVEQLEEEGQFFLKADPTHFLLALEAKRIELGYTFDPHYYANSSKINPLPHQLEAVELMMRRIPVCFLLADDPGAGKTIMAGLVLRQLKSQGAVGRTLIVTPASLLTQWQWEMQEKFTEEFRIANRGNIDSWHKDNQWIISIDFARQEEIKLQLSQIDWDLLIVDEAHKMAAYKIGQRIKKSKRYQLGEILVEMSRNIIFLTATPHKGDEENFLLFLKLLDPDIFANVSIMSQILREPENNIFLRRLKEKMRGFDDKPLFPNRYVKTITYELTEAEKHLYDSVTEYLNHNFSERFRDTRSNTGIGIARMVFQRRLASSTSAIARTLERRLNKVKQELARLEMGKTIKAPVKPSDIDETDWVRYTEEDIWEIEKLAEEILTNRDYSSIKTEIEVLSEITATAIELEDLQHLNHAENSKLLALHQLIDSEIKNTGEKLLVFTEHKDTLNFLVETIRDSWNYKVTCIHGGMKMGERKRSENEFNQKKGPQVLIATEAAGEGINLQKQCHIMINYDIPWNPARLEQRMGRIHRYGQTKAVDIFNLVTRDTVEGRVLNRILEKLEIMRSQLGDCVYDVINEILEDKRIDHLIYGLLTNKISHNQVYSTLDQFTTADVEKIGLHELANEVDLPRTRYKYWISQELKLSPEYLENFFLKAYTELFNTSIKRNREFWKIERVPNSLKLISRDLEAKYGKLKKSYPRITFSGEIALKYEDKKHKSDFIGPNHPLLQSLLKECLDRFGDLLKRGTILIDIKATEKQIWCLFLATLKDGLNQIITEKLVAVAMNDHTVLGVIDPVNFLDLIPPDPEEELPTESQQLEVDIEEEKAVSWLVNSHLENLFKKKIDSRKKIVKERKKYVQKSFAYSINEINKKLFELDRLQREEGRDERLNIQKRQKQLININHRKNNQLQRLEQESYLTVMIPELICFVRVLPPGKGLTSLAGEDKDVELEAMRIVENYERDSGRITTDVSNPLLRRGYDILSRSSDELRKIEVKGRALSGGIHLTVNEWNMAHRFKEEYWLYLVTDIAKGDPKLHIVQDPASKITAKEEKFWVNESEWKKYAIHIERI